MIVRIVKMEFRDDAIDDFKKLFEERKAKIRGFEGCEYLELLQGTGALKNIFYTYSYWQDEASLEKYRYSDLFAETWKLTKAGFSKRAEAISCTKLHKLP